MNSEHALSPAGVVSVTPAWVQTTAVFALALSAFLVNLDQPLHFDELYHILAARSWAADGEMRIAEGVYTRGWLYTAFLGWWFSLFGDDLVTARLPSALAVSLWVASLYLWTRRTAGNTAAWVAAILFALAPGTVWLSHFTRFYAFHGLFFWLGATGIYCLFALPFGFASIAVAIGAATCLGLALYFQMTTVIGFIGIALWVAFILGSAWFASNFSVRTRLLGAGAIGAAALACALGLLASDVATELWHSYRDVPLWNAQAKSYEGYYFNLFLAQYPVLWALLPIAMIVAIGSRPRPALFASLIFGTAFILHSFAGSKLERYIHYAMPYFFVIWGMAIAQLGPPALRMLRTATDRSLAAVQLDRPAWLQRWIRRAAMAAVAVFLLLASPGFTQTLSTLIRPPGAESKMAWLATRQKLQPLLDSVSVVVVTDELRSLYYLGRYDILLSRTRLQETESGREFAIDPRTGRPVISTAGSIERLLECFPTGLVISRGGLWRNEAMAGDEAADLVAERASPVELPAKHDMLVYRWETEMEPDPASCGTLPDIQGPAGARSHPVETGKPEAMGR